MEKYLSPYVYGKFSEARSYMARSANPLRERVGRAYLGWLLVIQDGDLQGELKEKFSDLKALLTEKPKNSWQGAVEATLATMHWRKVKKCADLIVDMADSAEYLVDRKFDYGSAA
jgi:hypothetical protein